MGSDRSALIGTDRFLARHDRRWFLKVAGGSTALAFWLRNGIARAAEAVDTGAARATLDGMVRISNSGAGG